MAEPKRISQLDAASPLTGAEQLPMVQNERTVQTTLSVVRSFTDTSCQCTLVSRYNEVGIPATSLLYFLHTYTLPANTLSTNGSWLHIMATGKFAANGNFKSAIIGVKQNGSSVGAGYGVQSTVYNNYYWELEIKLQRSSPNTYTSTRKVIVTPYNSGSQAGNVPDMYIDYTISANYSNLWLNDVQITVEGDSSAASANDITCGSFIVVLHKLDTNS